MSFSNLVLRDVVTSGHDAVGNSRYGEILGDDEQVKEDGVASRSGRTNNVKLGRMR